MSKTAPKPSNDRLRALRLLAAAPDGKTATLMMAHGFNTTLLADLVDAGLVTSRREHVGRGKRIEIVRLRITDEGRKAL